MQKAAKTKTLLILPARLAHERAAIAARTDAMVIVDGGVGAVHTIHLD